jgi:hypothetical protein
VAEGKARSDDESIAPSEQLLLRVPPDQVVPDKNQGRYRASGMAFNDDELSVYLSSQLRADGHTEEDVLYGHPEGWSVAAISAAKVREEGQIVVRDPDPNDPPRPYDNAHALVIGGKSTKRRRRLSRATVLVVEGDVPSWDALE